MLIKTLHRLGITSDVMYGAGLASIAASILAWRIRSGDDQGHAERLGIFVGLWTPSFFILGNGLKIREEANPAAPSDVRQGVQELTGTVKRVAETVNS